MRLPNLTKNHMCALGTCRLGSTVANDDCSAGNAQYHRLCWLAVSQMTRHRQHPIGPARCTAGSSLRIGYLSTCEARPVQTVWHHATVLLQHLQTTARWRDNDWPYASTPKQLHHNRSDDAPESTVCHVLERKAAW
jgi:hypothetical protein